MDSNLNHQNRPRPLRRPMDRHQHQQSRTSRQSFDNCKLVFMFMVVLWHLGNLWILEETAGKKNPLWSSVAFRAVHTYWIWTERAAVPGFVFLSGYFAKGFLHLDDSVKTKKRWEKTISTLLIGSLLWQGIYFSLGQLGNYAFTGTFLPIPHYADVWESLYTWYLIALFLWRLVTPLLGTVRQPTVVALCLSLLSAHTNHGHPLQMRNRFFFFFPFYTAGLQCPESWLEQCQLSHGIIGIVVTTVACLNLPSNDLSWKYTIDSWDMAPHLYLFFQYVLGGATAISVIAVVRSINFPLIPCGHPNSSLAIYESHWGLAGFLSWGYFPFTEHRIVQRPYFERIMSEFSPIPALILFHFICYLCCLILGNRVLYDTMLRHVCEPNCQWLFRPEVKVARDDENGLLSDQNQQGRSRRTDDDRLPLIRRPPVST